MRGHAKLVSISASLALGFCLFVAVAEEPNALATPSQVTDPQRIDRDGNQICGWDLMNDSERGGYRNLMHKTNALEDRDAIRADHCARMKARAKERDVKAAE